ncbi:adenylate cyclase class 2 [Croceifilum oryzae]|uniref:Adenylate cyclase class 2 n=1 Tax=Croceifilum oryzae TaxID=1553429 RepID=A0AAJ1TJ79_9BACL|nr:CYTH domain-containing protein [Croceifilum oryzae]MDQ0417111.1 adenylate cyclase class 2 [Croceifilum oryzae]
MSIEFEAKVIEINPQDLSEQILELGGEKLGEFFMRRYVYDIIPGDLSKWVRLRDNGKESTLTIKEIVHDGIDGTHELETIVDDFEITNRILEKLGYTAKSYQENRRTSFILNGVRLEIDEWPMIPPYLEIESDSKEQVVEVAHLLGYVESQLTGENTIKIYKQYGIDLNSISDLRF